MEKKEYIERGAILRKSETMFDGQKYCTAVNTVNGESEIDGAEKLCNQFADKSRFVELPLRIGQDAWCIRDYKGVKQPQKSEVSEMYFNQQMKLIIVVKYVGRGEYRKTVFRTEEEAKAALTERSEK